MTPPSDELLSQFMHGFYGYGNPKARWWFVGQEEGGAGSVDELSAHLEAWRDRGSRQLEDLAELQQSKGVRKYFGARPTFHPYWGRLARLLVAARGEEPTPERVGRCQGLEFGRADGDTCLVELLPLPKPDRASWNYSEFSALPDLSDLDTYMARVAPQRAAHLRSMILAAKPEAVFFCSTSAEFLQWWEVVAGTKLTRRILLPRRPVCLGGRRPVYVAVQNPSGARPPHMYWDEVARAVRETNAEDRNSSTPSGESRGQEAN